MTAGGYSSARLVENLINSYVGGKMFHFTLCWVYVVIFRNLNQTLDGDCLYLVTYRLEMSTCSTVEGLAISDLFYMCFGGSVGVSTQTRIEVN
jgi:hypothetical protein